MNLAKMYLSQEDMELINRAIDEIHYVEIPRIKKDLRLDSYEIEVTYYEEQPETNDCEFSMGFFYDPTVNEGKLIVDFYLEGIILYSKENSPYKETHLRVFLREFLETVAHEFRHIYQYVYKRRDLYYNESLVEVDADRYGQMYLLKNFKRFYSNCIGRS